MNSQASLYTHALRTIINQKHGSMLNTRSNELGILNVRRQKSGKIASGVSVRVEGGVAGEGRAVCVPKFHSWGKRTMPLTNINSDWMSNASSGLCINLFIYAGPLSCILGCNNCPLNLFALLFYICMHTTHWFV